MERLIFCFDGTCNSPDTFDDYLENQSITNVLKIHAMADGALDKNNTNPKIKDQKSFYYSGVGTRGGWVWRLINKAIAPPYGDIDDILDEAMEDLCAACPNAADTSTNKVAIFIFGFSRGAAIARRFASKIGNSGYAVRFLGVFDTVAATYLSLDLNPNTYPASDVLFENGTLGKHIKEAVHLVALDEKRIHFQPTLFNQDERVHEVWFAGVHSDIGGGYWFDGLSDITLEYMMEKAQKAGMKFLPYNEVDLNKLNVMSSKDAICYDDLFIRPLPTGQAHLQNVESFINKQSLAPRVPRVNQNDQPMLGVAPIIHHSVIERFNKLTNYRPDALRNRPFCVLRANGKISASKHGIAQL